MVEQDLPILLAMLAIVLPSVRIAAI